jgi:hypothetical protein
VWERGLDDAMARLAAKVDLTQLSQLARQNANFLEF